MPPQNANSWQIVLHWIELYRLGDLASIAGVLISIVGFCVTFVGVFKSKNAAERAEEAAHATRDSIRLLDTVVDFTAAITSLEEIKRLHRTSQWTQLPDRYATLRKSLVTIRATSPDLTNSQKAALQDAVTNLYEMESVVEVNLNSPAKINHAKFNSVISRNIDHLSAALAELKAAKTEFEK